jgi:hypothetical protein
LTPGNEIRIVGGTMTKGHNTRERRLLTDLQAKNRCSDQVRRLASRLRRWQAGMTSSRSHRRRRQYARSCERASARLGRLQQELLVRAEDLKTRIQQELSLSENEVQQFQEQYQREVAELRSAEHELAAARQKLQEAEAEALAESGPRDQAAKAGILSDLAARRRRAERKARVEARDVSRVEQEIQAEARDKVLLTSELQKILAEIAALRE